MRTFLLMIVLASLLPLAAGQWAPGTHVLYLDSNDAENGDAELTGFFSTVEDAGDDAALGPAASCATHTGQNAADGIILDNQGSAIDRTYTFEMRPAQPGMATIEGPVLARLHVGAGACYGEVTVTARILAGGQTIAEGSKEHTYNDASGNYPRADFELTVNQAAFDTSDMTIEVHVTGKTLGQLFLGIGSSRGFSQLEVPLVSLAAAGGVSYTDLDAPAALDLAFNGTTGLMVYNWTQETALGHWVVEGNGTGDATLMLVDGSNSTFAEVAVPGNHSIDIGEAVLGNWSLVINATAYNGTLSVHFAAPGMDHDDEVDEHDDQMDDDPGNETAEPDEKDSPAAPLLVAMTAVLWWVSRRR